MIYAIDLAGLLLVAGICRWFDRPRPAAPRIPFPKTLRRVLARRPRPEPTGRPPSAASRNTAPWSVVPQTEG
jgi:hypothetical protein